MGRITISYNRYNLSNEHFIDGANYYYIENTHLLAEANPKHFRIAPHDFAAVAAGKKMCRLGKDDALLSNVGPYAHIYHYLREKRGQKFRIIRDTQTSLWPGYLLQEKLCGKYMREGDMMMFLSEFARQVYLKLFPETLNRDNTCICSPFMHFFPKELPKNENDYGGLTLGWVGRVINEKNFHQALDAFLRLRKELDNVRFLAAGASSNLTKLGIKLKLKAHKVKREEFIYVNNGHFIPHNRVWHLYRQMDVFMFPSLSLNESLGRAMIEACYAGLPVVAACYGAAPEILDENNLVPVRYRDELLPLDIAYPYSFGEVDIGSLVEKLHNHRSLSRKNNTSRYASHDKKFFSILQGNKQKEKPVSLNRHVRKFVEKLYIYNDFTRLDDREIIKKTVRFVNRRADNTRHRGAAAGMAYSKENYYLLRKYNFFMPAFLDYHPYAALGSAGLKARLEKLAVQIQKPFVKPAKVALYLLIKRQYDSMRMHDFER